MTKLYDWDRFQSMTSRQKADVNTSTLFAEQREQGDEEVSPDEIGIKKMEEEVPIEWPDADKD